MNEYKIKIQSPNLPAGTFEVAIFLTDLSQNTFKPYLDKKYPAPFTWDYLPPTIVIVEDVLINLPDKGVIFTAPDGNKFKITIDNQGNRVTTLQ